MSRPLTAPPKSLKKSQQTIYVAVRVRPANEQEINGNYRNIVSILDDKVLCFDPPPLPEFTRPLTAQPTKIRRRGSSNLPKNESKRAKDIKFMFDSVMDTDTDQRTVYENTAKKLIEAVLSGHNGTMFAYGSTGSGKTTTMLGNDICGPGVMVYAMEDLFASMREQNDRYEFNVKLSYLEIYNETIKDLLDPKSKKVCSLRETPDGEMIISNLVQVELEDCANVFHYLKKGNAHRSQSATEANKTSSRSHAVLQVFIERKTIGAPDDVVYSKLSLVDLAGSERAARTKNQGVRLMEGANINRSLLALGNCINALTMGKKETVHSLQKF
eukprot:TRINITY_DN3034_c0_g1_i3.p1 TRINITY_DN3034_c0_g1~~TRINITY_DN3034_c0_g1_i3.p1  ORF type:complete len:342 (+),score=78.98 TRINITY_DN3034_c0_g1_i3:43-1026(+)